MADFINKATKSSPVMNAVIQEFPSSTLWPNKDTLTGFTGLCFPSLHLSTGDFETLRSQALSDFMRLSPDEHKQNIFHTHNATCSLTYTVDECLEAFSALGLFVICH